MIAPSLGRRSPPTTARRPCNDLWDVWISSFAGLLWPLAGGVNREGKKLMTRWETSGRLLERAKKSLAGGVSSPFRAKFPVPLYCADGCGSRLEDVDGNSYIDYALAWGPLILGHRHPRLVETLREYAGRPHIYGAQHELEFQVAEKLQELVPCAERVAFTSSGSEAVSLAQRLARAFTGRNRILKFEGHYHGWLDTLLLSYHPAAADVGSAEVPNVVLGSAGQVSVAAETVAVARWNDIDALEQVFRAADGDIAAVIMEPVLCNSGCLLPQPGYLQAVQETCQHHGALLIFDEIITGLRLSIGGAQQFYGVVPDLATLGKSIGGGLPLSAVVGRSDILELMCEGRVAFGGTFNGNPLSLAAAKTTLEILTGGKHDPLAEANRRGEQLMQGIRTSAGKHCLPLAVTGFGCAFAIHFTSRPQLVEYRDTFGDDKQALAKYLRLALEEGVYMLPDGRVYVSIAHTEEDVAETSGAIDRVFEKMAGET